MLPDLSGVEVCRRIKADPDLKDVFVVLVSGMATSVTHKVDGLEAGADDYLDKLLDPAEFLARVRTILRLRDATAALRASEQHYRRLVGILPEAVGVLNLQGRLLSVNPQGVAMLGYATPSELLEKSLFDLVSPEDHERIQPDVATTLAAGTLRNVHYTLLTKQGHPFPVELSATVARDTSGQNVGLVIICRDITEREHFETALTHSVQALQEHLAFLQTLMNAIPYPVFYKNAAGRYLGCNRAFEQDLGLAREQILGKKIHDVASRELAEKFHQADQALLEKPGIQTYESSIAYADGLRHDVVFNKATFQDAEGQVAGLIGTIIDVTERKRAAEQIQILADAVQSAGDMIYVTDQENRFTFANQAFLRGYGYAARGDRGEDARVSLLAQESTGASGRRFAANAAGRREGRYPQSPEGRNGVSCRTHHFSDQEHRRAHPGPGGCVQRHLRADPGPKAGCGILAPGISPERGQHR